MTTEEACRAIESEFSVALGNPDRVAVACGILREGLRGGLEPESLVRLTPLLERRSGAILRPLFELFEDAVRRASDPDPILIGMLGVRDGDLSRRVLDRTLELGETGRAEVGEDFASRLAETVEREGSPLVDANSLAKIGRILRIASWVEPRPGLEPCVDLYLHASTRSVRRLAARLLDNEAAPPPKRVEAMLGREAYRFLAPYLAYAQATHLDLLELAGNGRLSDHLLEDLASAEVILGERLLREVIVAAGWARLNLGIEVRERVGLSVDGSFPLALSPSEAKLIESCAGVRRTWRRFLVLVHGGGVGGETPGVSADSPVRRFRAYNLAHAEALGEILSVEPLSKERIERIVTLSDRLVEDFVSLFSGFDEEAADLPSAYAPMRRAVLESVAAYSGGAPPSKLTRLVQMFEDPRSLTEVHTLHGLKRYLHQKGLKLGFRLVETGRATNRTVDLLLVGSEKIQSIVRKIQYVDFEPDEDDGNEGARVPYPVQIVAEGMGRHILHDATSFPDVKIFCYGNEVHYYASYGTHPAFLRIDFAPPVRGGMIDLEYYGVSKNDLDHHPAPQLDAIRLFFRGMEFDCTVARTRIHARYDKERAGDLGDLCAKAEGLFRLLPLLMDIDWVIGSLHLDEEARGKVAASWCDFFLRWGVLPIEQFLTADRLGILTGVAPDPAGGNPIAWSGRGAYQDRFSSTAPARLALEMVNALGRHGLSEVVPFVDTAPRSFGQLTLERDVLRPLRDAVARGELLEGPGGLEPATGRFRRDHEAERFAALLQEGGEGIVLAAELARLIGSIERSIRFRATGNVNGYEVARACLELRGETAAAYVLRDRSGMARLAIFAREGRLFSSRASDGGLWRSNGTIDAVRVVSHLRRATYLSAGTTVASPEDVDALRDLFASPNPIRSASPVPGERVLAGVRAAPGRASGPAVLGTLGRTPADLEGAILVSASVRTDDNAFIYHSAGIVSTGGGILSHAGLLALQFQKPALLIDAGWDEAGRALVYRSGEYEEERSSRGAFSFAARRNLREREERIVDGDILELDVEEGLLRNLGREPDALALHEGLRQMNLAGRSQSQATGDAQLLALRGQRLRARHQLERLFRRLRDPNLARHAVRELFTGSASTGGARGECAALVVLLLENRSVADAAKDCVAGVLRDLEGRDRTCVEEARTRIPMTTDPHEVLSLRLDATRARERLREALSMAAASGLEQAWIGAGGEPSSVDAIDALARGRLDAIREGLIHELKAATLGHLRRHLLRRIGTLDSVLDVPAADVGGLLVTARELQAEENLMKARMGDRVVLSAGDAGLELAPLIGMKAANLSEIGRVLGPDAVPDWFVVTDAALEAILDVPVETEGGSPRLRDAIDEILSLPGANEVQKASLIHKLWSSIKIPERIERAVADAYRLLGAQDPPESEEGAGRTPVAVRSSGREEDTERVAGAGEFDTFLFVRGEREVLDTIRRVWSGLWSERAIHNRAVLGATAFGSGGGVLVQRICWSRVSGVLTTINVGEGRMREMVVNGGLGLGEGIVSGEVGADQVIVAKVEEPDESPLRFRYLTNDKREKVVFDRRRGQGTVRVETLYHERFRPALEYVELCELVRAATRLERVYGHPLDIEFGIEGDRLRLLQARPVTRTAAILRETIDRHPLSAPRTERGEGKETR